MKVIALMEERSPILALTSADGSRPAGQAIINDLLLLEGQSLVQGKDVKMRDVKWPSGQSKEHA